MHPFYTFSCYRRSPKWLKNKQNRPGTRTDCPAPEPAVHSSSSRFMCPMPTILILLSQICQKSHRSVLPIYAYASEFYGCALPHKVNFLCHFMRNRVAVPKNCPFFWAGAGGPRPIQSENFSNRRHEQYNKFFFDFREFRLQRARARARERDGAVRKREDPRRRRASRRDGSAPGQPGGRVFGKSRKARFWTALAWPSRGVWLVFLEKKVKSSKVLPTQLQTY